MMPEPLRKGDTIALVAPASPFETDILNCIVFGLESRGYKVALGKNAGARNGYLAGTSADRAKDLIEAFSSPDIAAVFCIRGGYGSGKLLQWLPFSSLRRHKKIFLGYSDITFLHLAFHSQMGWVTFHGPNMLDLVENSARFDKILETLSGSGSFSFTLESGEILRHGIATGRLLGGNLTCLAHLIGSSYLPELEGAVLIIEDCSEALYRLDRIFDQLKLAGILRRLNGLVLGRFKDCGEIPKIWDMVMEQVREYHFPVVANVPFGHIPENHVIPLGIPFILNTYERSFAPRYHPLAG